MTKPNVTALLIDTVSIQQYIFSSNKLKENLGASYIIEELVYGEILDIALNDWKSLTLFTNELQGVGYIGGGNALLLLSGESDYLSLIRIYTTLLLQYFPGLKTAFTVLENFYDEHLTFKVQRKNLNQKLVSNKNLNYCSVVPFKHGIVEDCSISNEAQETSFEPFDNMISKVSWSKLNACNVAQEEINERYSEVLNKRFRFTDELDKLGQAKDKGYIAVVHLDGNGMGAEFMEKDSIEKLSIFSEQVKKKADACIKELIKHVTEMFSDEGYLLNDNSLKLEAVNESRKVFYLPIRPIISGGDDVTFVCEGRLGIYLAEKLIKLFNDYKIGDMSIPSCAGIAIVHTKYPFYRAYQLAEELTAQAKKEAKKLDSSSCWLNFLSSSSGFSGSLEEVQKQMFDTPNGSLFYGPYRVDETEDEKSFSKLKTMLVKFSDSWPRNKLKELRDILRRDESRQAYFIKEAEASGLFANGEVSSLFTSSSGEETAKTMYNDLVELTNFYPKYRDDKT